MALSSQSANESYSRPVFHRLPATRRLLLRRVIRSAGQLTTISRIAWGWLDLAGLVGRRLLGEPAARAPGTMEIHPCSARSVARENPKMPRERLNCRDAAGCRVPESAQQEHPIAEIAKLSGTLMEILAFSLALAANGSTPSLCGSRPWRARHRVSLDSRGSRARRTAMRHHAVQASSLAWQRPPVVRRSAVEEQSDMRVGFDLAQPWRHSATWTQARRLRMHRPRDGAADDARTAFDRERARQSANSGAILSQASGAAGAYCAGLPSSGRKRSSRACAAATRGSSLRRELVVARARLTTERFLVSQAGSRS